MDEVFLKVNGVQHYLWRAVDHEGEVLKPMVTKTRDRNVSWLTSMPRSCGTSSTFLSESGNRTWSITARRMISGKVLKYRKGERWVVRARVGARVLSAASQFP